MNFPSIYVDEVLDLERARSVIQPLMSRKLTVTNKPAWFEFPDGGVARRARMRRRRAKRR